MAEDILFNGSRIQKHRRLVIGKWLRDAMTIEYTAADLGTGKAQGPLVRDRICLASENGVKACVKPGIVAASSLDDVPFRKMPSDGILGLGLEGISVSPAFNFLTQLIKGNKGMHSMFGMSFGRTGGELHIGGYDPVALAAPLKWFPVHSPEEGYWQVPIYAVRVGNTIVNPCHKGCHAIMDTSASRLGVQESNLLALQTALAASVRASDGGCKGPVLEFDLGGMTVDLGADDYTTADCSPDLGPLELEDELFSGVYAFGEMVLNHYFVVFDWEKKAMGFAPTAGAIREEGKVASEAEIVEVTV